jgi:DNA-binding transcriptional LysR family regulator
MELRRLHYFVVLAEELNFRRAADRLCIAQPGLSQQIRVLEREIGAALFQRGRTGVSLTRAGEVLRDRAVPLLGQVDRMIDEVQGAATGRSGTIRLGSLRSIIDSRADEILQTFQQANPAVRVILDASWETRHDKFSMLREAVVDAAFIHLPQPEIDDELAVLPLGTNELVVALPRAHPLARRRKIRSEDLTGTSLILWPRDQAPLQFDEIRSIAWSDQAIDLVASEPDVERLLARVAASPGGVSVVDAPRAARLRPRGVVFRPFTPPVPAWAFGLVWMPRRVSPVLELFLGWCRDHAIVSSLPDDAVDIEPRVAATAQRRRWSAGRRIRHEARGVEAACQFGKRDLRLRGCIVKDRRSRVTSLAALPPVAWRGCPALTTPLFKRVSRGLPYPCRWAAAMPPPDLAEKE